MDEEVFKQILTVHNHTIDERPILVFTLNHLVYHIKRKNRKQFIAYVENHLQTVIQRAEASGHPNFVAMIFFEQGTYQSINLNLLLPIMKVFKKPQYADRLYKCYVIDMPRKLKKIYNFIKIFLSPETKQKYIFKNKQLAAADCFQSLEEEVEDDSGGLENEFSSFISSIL